MMYVIVFMFNENNSTCKLSRGLDKWGADVYYGGVHIKYGKLGLKQNNMPYPSTHILCNIVIVP